MKKKTTRIICLILAAVLVLGLLAGLVTVKAAEIDYRYGSAGSYSNVVYNWGTRGTVATELSPMAESFYATYNANYEELAQMAGSTNTADIPSSQLFKELRTLVTNAQKKTTSYDATRDLYQFTDCQDSARTTTAISSFYSGKSIGPAWDSGSTWNREHTWPNSKGDANGSGENDIMMLRPTATTENGSRGNKAYGVSSGFFSPNTASGGAYDLRGDVARIVLYVYVRWQNTSSSAAVLFGSSGVIESKEVLLDWIAVDPVDTWELGRNDSVQSITGTRNVFVDYPELAYTLFGEEVPADMGTPSNGIGVPGTGSGTVTPDPNPQPSGSLAFVDAPVAGTAYKLGMQQNGLTTPTLLTFTGAMNGYYYGTSDKAEEAVDVYLEETTGGYHIYFMDGTTKTYLDIIQREDYTDKVNVVLQTTGEHTVYTLNLQYKYIMANVLDIDWYLGTYSTNKSISASKTSYIADTSLIGVSQFCAWLMEVDENGTGSGTTPNPDPTPDPEPTPTPGTGEFGKISSMAELTTGEYVMVVSTGYAPGVVDGTWVSAVEPTVEGNTVTDAKGGVWTLTVDGTTASLKDANGVFVGPKGGNYNGIATGEEYKWDIVCTNGLFTFKGTGEDTVVLASNATGDYGNKFRGYKTSTVAAAASTYPSTFTLYKKGATGSTTPDPTPTPTPVPNPEGCQIVTAPQTGTAYKLIIDQKTNGTVLYFNGTVESREKRHHLGTTTNAAEAVDVYLETAKDGYAMYFLQGQDKIYIRLYEYTDGAANAGKGRLEMVAQAPDEILTFNTTYNTLTYVADAKNTYTMGTYSTYSTFSSSNMSYFSTTSVDVTQFPARLAILTEE